MNVDFVMSEINTDFNQYEITELNRKISSADDIRRIMDLDVIIIMSKYLKTNSLTNNDRNHLSKAIIKYILTPNMEKT